MNARQIAARELGIVCYPKRNFLSASIPVDRKSIHIKKCSRSSHVTDLSLIKFYYRLLARGHKVGIVDQQETAAPEKGKR